MVNEFVVSLNRDIQIPLNVTTLDAVTEITIETPGGKYRIGWQGDSLAVHSYEVGKTWYPVDKDNHYLVRDRKTGEPVMYRLQKQGGVEMQVTSKRKKKKKGC